MAPHFRLHALMRDRDRVNAERPKPPEPGAGILTRRETVRSNALQAARDQPVRHEMFAREILD